MSERRDQLKSYLEKHGIETKIHYTNILDRVNSNYYPVAEKICAQALSLPVYPFLTDNEVKYICEKIRQFNGI